MPPRARLRYPKASAIMPVMARPSTLTPEITSQLCAARRVGATLKAASGAVGVPYARAHIRADPKTIPNSHTHTENR